MWNFRPWWSLETCFPHSTMWSETRTLPQWVQHSAYETHYFPLEPRIEEHCVTHINLLLIVNSPLGFWLVFFPGKHIRRGLVRISMTLDVAVTLKAVTESHRPSLLSHVLQLNEHLCDSKWFASWGNPDLIPEGSELLFFMPISCLLICLSIEQ